MKKYVPGAVLMILVGCGTNEMNRDAVTLDSYADSVGYVIGMDIGKTFSSREIEVDVASFQAGFEAVYTGGEAMFSDSLAFAINREYQSRWQAERQAEAQKVAQENREAGETFLNENKQNEDVTVLPSGLQYRVLVSGDGDAPPAGSNVLVKYEGRHLDGTIFDTTYDRAEPINLNLKQVIRGWQEAIPRMRVGDEWELFIPSNLAYGPRGSGGAIGPDETLIFKVKLEGVE